MTRLLGMVLAAILLLPLGCLASADSQDPGGGNAAPLTLLHQGGKALQQGQVVDNDQDQLRDIRGPVPLVDQPPWLLIGSILLAFTLLGAAIFWYLKKRRIRPAAPPTPPWELALQELARARELLSPEWALLYMDRVSQILRSYIETRFPIRSTRQTTREFLASLAAAGETSPLAAYKKELRSCLEAADMAKFAHHVPAIDHLERIEGAVTTFIRSTRPAEPQKGAKAGSAAGAGGGGR